MTSEATMTRDIREAMERSRGTLLADAMGVVALVVMLVGTLCLPHLI
jgi:hypothetical protein